MQPNSYYGFGMTPLQQSQSQPMQPQSAAKPAKKHNGLVPVVIILLLICIGLGVYIAIDKLSKPATPDTIVQADPTSISEPISKIEFPRDETRDDELAKALVSRIFTADTAEEQTIEFNSNTEFTLGYYKDPTLDYRKVQPNTSHGTYKITGNHISLSSGDSFRLENDYLIKANDELSSNTDTVYFDVHQIKTTFNNINTAFNTYIVNQIKANKGSIAADRTVIDFGSITCFVGNNHLTNADNYACNVNYTIYATKDAADKAIADSNKKPENPSETNQETVAYKDFQHYCELNTTADFVKFATCGADYTIKANANIIVRIDENGYRITGLYH